MLLMSLISEVCTHPKIERIYHDNLFDKLSPEGQ